MKPYQIKHLQSKISEIFHQKHNALQKKMTVPGRHLSETKQLALIRAGVVKLKSNKEIAKRGYGAGLGGFFDLSKHCWPTHLKPEYEKALDKLSNNRDRVLDEIILGGCDKALEILKKWETSSKTS